MRIVVLASWYPTPESTAGSFVRDQVMALAEDYDMAVIAPRIRRFRERLRSRGGCPTEVDHGVLTLRPVVFPLVPFSRSGLVIAYRRAAESALQWLSAHWGNPDIIHAHVVVPAGLAGVGLASQWRVPLVITEHSGPLSMHLRSSRDVARCRGAFRASAVVIAVGPTLRDQILAIAPDARVKVVGNVVDTSFFRPPTDLGAQDEPRINVVSVGSLHPVKGIDTLLRAFSVTAAKFPTATLRIVGDGPCRSVLQRLADRLGIGPRCCFLGQVDRAHVLQELRAASVFVSSSRVETFGVAVAEAMACGVPVVVTRSGGPEHFVAPGTGLVVDPDDPDALASAITQILGGQLPLSPSLAREVVLQSFSPDVFRRTMRGIYNTLSHRS